MAYMVYQQLTTSVMEAYRDRSDTAASLEQATNYRRWLDSLAIDVATRASLVEQARAVEDGLNRALQAGR